MTNQHDSFCSKCGKSGHLAGSCASKSQHVRPRKPHPAERVFEKNKFSVKSAQSPDQTITIPLAEYKLLKSGSCPKCTARREYNTALKRELRAKAGSA